MRLHTTDAAGDGRYSAEKHIWATHRLEKGDVAAQACHLLALLVNLLEELIHHVAKTRPRNISAHHELALLLAWFPRARVNSSAHMLAPRALAAARTTGAATAPRATSAHCQSAKEGKALSSEKNGRRQKSQIARRLLTPSECLTSSRARKARTRPKSRHIRKA